MMDIKPVMLALKKALRKPTMDDYDGGYQAGLRHALRLIDEERGLPF